MKIRRSARAGSLESCDCHVTADPADTLEIAVESPLLRIYGRKIREAVARAAAALGVSGAAIRVVDRGALDPTLASRVEACLRRALAEEGEAG